MNYYAHTATLPDGKPDRIEAHWQLLSAHFRGVARSEPVHEPDTYAMGMKKRRVAFRPAVGTRKPNARRCINMGTPLARTQCNLRSPSGPGPIRTTNAS